VRALAPSVITRTPWHIPLNESMSRRESGRAEEAVGQQIEAGPAAHLALAHLPAIPGPYDGALTPRPRDGGQVRPEPLGQASEGRPGALGRADEPWSERRRRTRADAGGTALCQRHRLRPRWRRLGLLRQLVAILCRRPRQRTEGQPWWRIVRQRSQPCRQPRCHLARRTAWSGSRMLRSQPCRDWRSGNVGLGRERGPGRRLRRTYWALASSVPPGGLGGCGRTGGVVHRREGTGLLGKDGRQ